MILLVGPLPPPVHGASSVTLHVRNLIEAEGMGLQACSVSPPENAGGISYHLNRLGLFLSAIWEIVKAPRGTGVYHSISGGAGLVYDILVAMVARLKRFPTLIHHHSFAYCNQYSLLMQILVKLGGKRQTHLALCGRMAGLLVEMYKVEGPVEVLSNGAFRNRSAKPSSKKGPLRRIGYLSNITREKGGDRFIALAEELYRKGWQGEAIIAGPIASSELKEFILERVAALEGLSYIGPVDAAGRARFLDDIDLMVFPTRYVNEAEPLVVLEAQEAGVPVAASNRGCIGEMIGAEAGLLLDESATDISELVNLILDLSSNGEAMEKMRERIVEGVATRMESDVAARQGLVEMFGRLEKGEVAI